MFYFHFVQSSFSSSETIEISSSDTSSNEAEEFVAPERGRGRRGKGRSRGLLKPRGRGSFAEPVPSTSEVLPRRRGRTRGNRQGKQKQTGLIQLTEEEIEGLEEMQEGRIVEVM